MHYWLVMPAAGSGQRFDAALPKQYAPLAGRTVMECSLAPFLADPRCARAVVVIAPGDPHWPQMAARLAPERVTAVEGGARRSESVRRGLAALAAHATPGDWVLVHDAARPCLEPAELERLLAELAEHPVGGLLATPTADTLKRAAQGLVESTLDRRDLWRALTPQMFRFGRLCTALDAAHAATRFPTDEAQALEWLGERPRLIAGAASNLKITTRDDLLLAGAVLSARAAPGAGRTS